MMELSQPGFCMYESVDWGIMMQMLKDITEVIVYVVIMGFIGCAAGMGLMNCIGIT